MAMASTVLSCCRQPRFFTYREAPRNEDCLVFHESSATSQIVHKTGDMPWSKVDELISDWARLDHPVFLEVGTKPAGIRPYIRQQGRSALEQLLCPDGTVPISMGPRRPL